MHFRTMNSTYTIDTDAMTWSREVHDPRSNMLLADSGPIITIPEPVVGQRCIITEGPAGIHEVIYTSAVVEVYA